MNKKTLLLLLGLFTTIATVSGQIITTIAGGGPGSLGDGGAATSAGLSHPYSTAMDNSGNLYIADRDHNRIRKVDAAGIITTVAGTGSSGYNGDGIPAVTAKIWGPFGVTVDNLGNLYFTDCGNHRIRKVSPDGVISTIAGTGIAGYNGDGSPASLTELNNPLGIVVDHVGNIVFSDAGNRRIRRIGNDGTITTIAGTGVEGYTGDGGAAISAQIKGPYGIAVDATGAIYFADLEADVVRKISSTGTISTIAGTGVGGFSGDGGSSTMAKLKDPTGVAVDNSGNIYVADANNSRIRKVTSSGVITTICGKDSASFNGDGRLAATATLKSCTGVMVHGNDLYISDFGNNRVRRISSIVSVGEHTNFSEAPELICYPNPSKADLFIKVSHQQMDLITVTVLSVEGKIVFQKQAQEFHHPLHVNLTGGAYIILAESSGKISQQKVVIIP